MTINAVTSLNVPWGICGFASTLAAMYSHSPTLKSTVDAAAAKGHLNTRLPAEIKTYLMMLKAENKIALLNEIRDFTRSFGAKYAAFTIDGYIAKINQIAVNPNLVVGFSAMRKHNLSIAMPPNAVLAYLKMVHDMKNARIVEPATLKGNNVILGLGTGDKTKPYNGLRHYVYMENNMTVYNYGKVGSLASQLQAKNYKVLFEIKLS
jgi:hypothetical protein